MRRIVLSLIAMFVFATAVPALAQVPQPVAPKDAVCDGKPHTLIFVPIMGKTKVSTLLDPELTGYDCRDQKSGVRIEGLPQSIRVAKKGNVTPVVGAVESLTKSMTSTQVGDLLRLFENRATSDAFWLLMSSGLTAADVEAMYKTAKEVWKIEVKEAP